MTGVTRHLLYFIIKTGVVFSLFTIFQGCNDEESEPTGGAPRIISFSPSSGVAGSTVVTIEGENFSPNADENIVEFYDHVRATQVEVIDDTKLKVTVPQNANSGGISITVNEITAVSTQDFRVTDGPTLMAFAPTQGSTGSTVNIIGHNFSAVKSENVVKFNNITAGVIDASTRWLTVTVPSGNFEGKITVSVNQSEAATTTTDFTLLEGTKVTKQYLNGILDMEYAYYPNGKLMYEKDMNSTKLYMGYYIYDEATNVLTKKQLLNEEGSDVDDINCYYHANGDLNYYVSNEGTVDESRFVCAYEAGRLKEIHGYNAQNVEVSRIFYEYLQNGYSYTQYILTNPNIPPDVPYGSGTILFYTEHPYVNPNLTVLNVEYYLPHTWWYQGGTYEWDAQGRLERRTFGSQVYTYAYE